MPATLVAHALDSPSPLLLVTAQVVLDVTVVTLVDVKLDHMPLQAVIVEVPHHRMVGEETLVVTKTHAHRLAAGGCEECML